MKAILTLIFSSIAFCSAQTVQIQGQRNLTTQWVYFGADSARTIYLINSQFFKDSANLGTVKKRIDNTADSCSLPIRVSTTAGAAYPVWLYRLSLGVKSNVADSNTFGFRVQVRDYTMKRGGPVAMAWMPYKLNNGYADVTVIDSLVIANNARTAKTRQYSLWFALGDEARFCVEQATGSFKVATDTLIIDSIYTSTR